MTRCASVLVAGLVGCTSTPDTPIDSFADATSDVVSTKLEPECEEIAQACHLYDKGPDSGLPHRCHQLHKEFDAGTCRAMRAECLAGCGGDGGVAADAAVSDSDAPD